MDTPPGDRLDDRVLRQLKKLREGAGLSRDRLAAAGAVMSALGTSDADEAFGRLLVIIDGLDGQQAAVLRVDFAIDLGHSLDRKPTAREERWLGERRVGYSQVIGRDPKTLSRWSDVAIGELRVRLLNDSYTGDLYVVAAEKSGRIVGISLIQEEPENPVEGSGQVNDQESPQPITGRRSLDYRNPTDQPSLPCLLYAFPRDWRPKSLTLVVSFLEEPHPFEVWAFQAPNFIEASYAAERYPLAIEAGTATCRFVNPRRDRMYGCWWRWDGESIGPMR